MPRLAGIVVGTAAVLAGLGALWQAVAASRDRRRYP
jgi:hypothetical protein